MLNVNNGSKNYSETLNKVENLKSNPDGWKICVEDIIYGNSSSDEEFFYLLIIIEYHLKKRLTSHDSDSYVLKIWMLDWMNKINTRNHSPIILNKMAQLFSLVFVREFPSYWANFFDELFFNQLNSEVAVTFFLKTLIEIDVLVVNKEMNRPAEQAEKSTFIKDAMRNLCIIKISYIWNEILGATNYENCKLCLQVITSYVDWIDVELIANDQIFLKIIDMTKVEDLSEFAIGAIGALLDKGMDPVNKFKLITQTRNLIQERRQFPIEEINEDDWMVVAELVEKIGNNLIACCVQLEKNGEKIFLEHCQKSLEDHVPLSLMCLAKKDYEISRIVIPFLRDYLTMHRGKKLSANVNDFLDQIIRLSIGGFERPEVLNLADEADFVEHRRELKFLLISSANFKPVMILNELEIVANEMCNVKCLLKATQIDAILNVVLALPEILGKSYTSETNQSLALRVRNIVIQVLSANLTFTETVYVNETFFELINRFCGYIDTNSESFITILRTFLDERGLRHNNAHLRGRAAYCFHRFIKMTKSSIGKHSNNILENLITLIIPVAQNYSTFSYEDLKCLFEAASTLIVYGTMDSQVKNRYMDCIISSIVEKFISYSNQLMNPIDQGELQRIYSHMCHLVSFCSKCAKPITSGDLLNTSGCKSVFMQLTRVFLERIDSSNLELLDNLRQFLHCMLVCFESDFLFFVKAIFEKIFFLSINNVKLFGDFLILAQQIIHKLQSSVFNTGIDMNLFFQLIWRIQMSYRANINDENLKNSYTAFSRTHISFVNSVINSCTQSFLLLLLQNSSFIDGFSNSIEVLCTYPDLTVRKNAYLLLVRIFSIQSSDQMNALNALWERLWSEAVLFSLRSIVSINPGEDAQSMALYNEICCCLQVLRERLTNQFDTTLTSFFPAEIASQLISDLSTIKGKALGQNVLQTIKNMNKLRVS